MSSVAIPILVPCLWCNLLSLQPSFPPAVMSALLPLWTPSKTFEMLAVRDLQSRLLDQLSSLPLCLLGDSSTGVDFVLRPDPRPVGVDISYALPGNLSPFEPVVMGCVKRIEDGGPHFMTLELVIPPYAPLAVASFFCKQTALLAGILAANMDHIDPQAVYEDVIPWSVGPSTSIMVGHGDRIFVGVPDSATVVRNTPRRVFSCSFSDARSVSPDSSTASTLSSTDIEDDGILHVRVGDLVAVKCYLNCKDCPRPPVGSCPSVVRVCGITALEVEVIV
ncbi:hypothetical protein FB451DRAFT_1405962 [Mycena latifolia]|nr:hypothetical protein FB451DRAFT_1405962 [Mycena latifolia]